MTYASGGLIQAVDYNTLSNTLASQMGTGTTFHGLGQTTSSYANVAGGNVTTVTAAQWTNLIAAANNGLLHEGQAAITASPAIAAGAIITYESPIATAPTTVYNNSGTTGLALSDSAANTTSYASAWGTTGSRSLVFTQSLTFASGDAARYFFNAGGKVKLTISYDT
jgi:hypothetical protein